MPCLCNGNNVSKRERKTERKREKGEGEEIPLHNILGVRRRQAIKWKRHRIRVCCSNRVMKEMFDVDDIMEYI